LASDMHMHGAIAMSEITTFRGNNIMKKLFATLTALAFVLGLTAAGFAQTTVKEEAKPVVKTQTPGAATQVTPAAKDKCKTKETKESKVKGKKPETLASKKDNDKKPVASVAETKNEASKTATK
jgi:hypothetical protein